MTNIALLRLMVMGETIICLNLSQTKQKSFSGRTIHDACFNLLNLCGVKKALIKNFK